ncbi:hypothetical protein LTR86_008905 [Recurvomyces mirabilis]|nr:hypothetical protein LTR86_008905 [Recurvomyces mirabilis]
MAKEMTNNSTYATLVEPITGGDVSGAALNGTLSAGGAAAIGIYVNQTVHRPFVEVWGKTDDDVPFFVQIDGIGAVLGQFASARISIGGCYAYLENEFVLASLSDNAAQPPTEATVQAWIVSRKA